MKEHEDHIRGFHHLSKAWYWPACLPLYRKTDENFDEVTFGFYSLDGGTSGEMSVTWETLNMKPVPKLEVFNDAWHALSHLQDVLEEMAKIDDEDISPEQFCELLLKCGFKDLTARKHGG
jgi:hypothetical protein